MDGFCSVFRRGASFIAETGEEETVFWKAIQTKMSRSKRKRSKLKTFLWDVFNPKALCGNWTEAGLLPGRNRLFCFRSLLGWASLPPLKRRGKTRRRPSTFFSSVCFCLYGMYKYSRAGFFKWLCGVLDLDEAWLNLLSPHSCGPVRISAESHFFYFLHPQPGLSSFSVLSVYCSLKSFFNIYSLIFLYNVS